MKIITETLTIDELNEIAKGMFGNLVKAVVDLGNRSRGIDDGEIRRKIAEIIKKRIKR